MEESNLMAILGLIAIRRIELWSAKLFQMILYTDYLIVLEYGEQMQWKLTCRLPGQEHDDKRKKKMRTRQHTHGYSA